MRPVQGNRTILTLAAYFIRLVPVRSAPAYVHQLQTKATIFGSKSAIKKYINIHLREPLLQSTSVREYILVYQLIWYGRMPRMFHNPDRDRD